MEPVMLVVVIH